MDGPVDEPPRGTPNRRALGAMEQAVQRARAAGPPSPTQPAKPFERPPKSASPPGEPTPDQARYRARNDERWLIASVAVAATLVVTGAVALALSSSNGGRQAASPSSGITAPRHSGSPAGGRPHAPGAGRQPGPSAAPTTPSTTALPPSPGGPPVISSLSPASGPAGEGVQVAGSNFLSSDGQIVASFNGQVAPTSCPAQNVCTVTVPPMAGPAAAAQVTITTAGGISNAVTFTYS